MTNSEAFRILTRELTNMHHTERTILGEHKDYQAALDAVKAGNNLHAIFLVTRMRTEAGDKWRAKGHMIFVN